MTGKINTIGKYDYSINYINYGGEIYPSDFYRKTSMSDMASRIESDIRYEEKLKKMLKVECK